MIAMNYHRVEDSAAPDFYTVPPARLAGHLRMIRELGMRVIGTDEAITTRIDGGLVMLHFDDGTSDHFNEVFPLLESEGVKGVFFISTAKIGRHGYLTPTEIQQLSKAGHSIECHGHSHRRMDRMAADQLDRELETSVGMIHKWTGRTPCVLAPPGGFINRKVIEASRRHGMDCVRTMSWNTTPIPLRGVLDCLVVRRSTTDSQFQRWLRGRGILALRAGYVAKQAIRSLLPLKFYLKLRNFRRRDKVAM